MVAGELDGVDIAQERIEILLERFKKMEKWMGRDDEALVAFQMAKISQGISIRVRLELGIDNNDMAFVCRDLDSGNEQEIFLGGVAFERRAE